MLLSRRCDVLWGLTLASHNGDSSAPLRLFPGYVQRRAWSPGGYQTALHEEVAFDFETIVLDGASGRADPLAPMARADLLGAWSPDGTRIAFTTNRDGDRKAYLLAVDGSAEVKLTHHAARDGSPTGSPGG